MDHSVIDVKRRAIHFKKEQSDFYQSSIFTIIKDLGECSTNEIKRELDKFSRIYAEGRYKLGFIKKNEIEKLFKENTMRRETIQRKLKKMVNEGSIIKNNNNKYTISELASTDLRYFNSNSGVEFGNLLLNSLLMSHFPTIDDFKTNIEKIVIIFGFYLVYSLIEACRPIKIDNKDKYIENKAKDGLSKKWFEQSVNHKKILDSFIATVTNQYTDKQRNEYIEKHYRKIDKNSEYIAHIDDPPDPISDPMSAKDFCLVRFLSMSSKESYVQYRTASNPSYEINEDLIDQINSILKELYPKYYESALFIRNDFFGRPKEGSLQDK